MTDTLFLLGYVSRSRIVKRKSSFRPPSSIERGPTYQTQLTRLPTEDEGHPDPGLRSLLVQGGTYRPHFLLWNSLHSRTIYDHDDTLCYGIKRCFRFRDLIGSTRFSTLPVTQGVAGVQDVVYCEPDNPGTPSVEMKGGVGGVGTCTRSLFGPLSSQMKPDTYTVFPIPFDRE